MISRPSPAIREKPVATAKIAVLTASRLRRRGGLGPSVSMLEADTSAL